MDTGGYIKLHRSALDSWLWTMPAEQRIVAITLLLLVNWRPGSVMSGGRKVDIPRGSTMTSLESLAKLSGASIRTVRSAIHNLEKAGFLTRQSTNRHTVISIVNYDTYQERDEGTDTQSDKPATSQRQASDKPATTIEEGKKLRREEREQQDPPASPPGDAGPVAQLSMPGETVCDKAERAKLGERAANEGYARELVAWLNGKRRELTPGIHGNGFNPLAGDTVKAAARLRKAKVPIGEAIAALELRLASYRRIGPDAARNNLTPATMLNTKFSAFVEQVRAGHTYTAEGGKPQDVRIGRLEPQSREFFEKERDAGEEF